MYKVIDINDQESKVFLDGKLLSTETGPKAKINARKFVTDHHWDERVKEAA